MAYWAVAISQPNRERTALVHLERQGYRAYCPMARRQRVKKGRKVEVHVPLFPRYLFVEVDSDRWWSLRGTRGLASIIMDHQREQPMQVRDSVIETVRKIEETIVEPASRFKAGQRVTLIDGPFTGLPAVWVGQSARDREFVLLELLGRSTRVEVATAELQ